MHDLPYFLVQHSVALLDLSITLLDEPMLTASLRVQGELPFKRRRHFSAVGDLRGVVVDLL